jgi:hypothetical protein
LFCWWCFTPRLSWLCTGGARGVFRDSRGFIHPFPIGFPSQDLRCEVFFFLSFKKEKKYWRMIGRAADLPLSASALRLGASSTPQAPRKNSPVPTLGFRHPPYYPPLWEFP